MFFMAYQIVLAYRQFSQLYGNEFFTLCIQEARPAEGYIWHGI